MSRDERLKAPKSINVINLQDLKDQGQYVMNKHKPTPNILNKSVDFPYKNNK
jgi:hypothetical protein